MKYSKYVPTVIHKLNIIIAKLNARQERVQYERINLFGVRRRNCNRKK